MPDLGKPIKKYGSTLSSNILGDDQLAIFGFLKKFNLKNKTAIVTGAGKGLGRACAIALAEAGANLIIISRTKKDLDEVSKVIKKFKSKCKSYVCDLTNYNKIKNIINEQKKIDILINTTEGIN